MGARRHGQGGTCPTRKCCRPKVFLWISKCCRKSQMTKYLCIIFEISRQLKGGSAPDPHWGSTLGLCWRTSAPRLLICPPLEKILRAHGRKCRVGEATFRKSPTPNKTVTLYRNNSVRENRPWLDWDRGRQRCTCSVMPPFVATLTNRKQYPATMTSSSPTS